LELGRKFGDFEEPDGGPIALALGEYLLAFARVEARLAFLFAFMRGFSMSSPPHYLDHGQYHSAQDELDQKGLSAGELARQVDELVTGALGCETELEISVLDEWKRLTTRGKQIIDQRNTLVHKQLPSVVEILGSPEKALLLWDGEVIDESDLRRQTEPVWDLRRDLTNFVGTFLGVKIRGVGPD
jgi:hypothetical protein